MDVLSLDFSFIEVPDSVTEPFSYFELEFELPGAVGVEVWSVNYFIVCLVVISLTSSHTVGIDSFLSTGVIDPLI